MLWASEVEESVATVLTLAIDDANDRLPRWKEMYDEGRVNGTLEKRGVWW